MGLRPSEYAHAPQSAQRSSNTFREYGSENKLTPISSANICPLSTSPLFPSIKSPSSQESDFHQPSIAFLLPRTLMSLIISVHGSSTDDMEVEAQLMDFASSDNR